MARIAESHGNKVTNGQSFVVFNISEGFQKVILMLVVVEVVHLRHLKKILRVVKAIHKFVSVNIHYIIPVLYKI